MSFNIDNSTSWVVRVHATGELAEVTDYQPVVGWDFNREPVVWVRGRFVNAAEYNLSNGDHAWYLHKVDVAEWNAAYVAQRTGSWS